MRNILIVISLFFACICCSQPVIWQDSIHYDFGDVKQNVAAKHDFVFHNNTDKTIEIDVVRTTCSCTDSEWTMAPIPPGGEGHVIAIYDSKLQGYFSKKLKVYFKKIKGSTVLRIDGYVE